MEQKLSKTYESDSLTQSSFLGMYVTDINFGYFGAGVESIFYISELFTLALMKEEDRDAKSQ